MGKLLGYNDQGALLYARAIRRVHNRFRDFDERWKSASTGRRNRRLIQQGGAGGFACRFNGHNQWSASKLNKFPKTVRRPAIRREYGPLQKEKM